jgi:hypothetical protein
MSHVLVPSSQELHDGSTQPNSPSPGHSPPPSPPLPPNRTPSPASPHPNILSSSPSSRRRSLSVSSRGGEEGRGEGEGGGGGGGGAIHTDRFRSPHTASSFDSNCPQADEDDEDDESPKLLSDDDEDLLELRLVERQSAGPPLVRRQSVFGDALLDPYPNNQQQWYSDRGMPEDMTQDMELGKITAHLSPQRPINLSGPSSGMGGPMTADSVEFMPCFNKEAIDRLYDECPQANVGGGNVQVLSFAARVKAASVLVRGRYNGFIETYKFGGTTRAYGRLYCSNGAQAIMGKARRHLFHGIYEDVDIQNAQPAMLLQLMGKMGYQGECSAIERYCDHRLHCLELVMDACGRNVTKDDAKTLFISILFGSTLRSWEDTHGMLAPGVRDGLLVPWERQVSAFVQYFIAQRGAEVAAHDLKTDEQIESEGKSVAHRRFSLFMQNEERIAVMHAIDFINSLPGASVGVLIHDGILARVPGGAAATLDALRAHVLAKSGYDLAFAVKSTTPSETLDELIAILKGAPTNLELPTFDPKVNQDALFCDAFRNLNAEKLLWDQAGVAYHYGDGTYPAQGRGIWHTGQPPGIWWDNVFPGTPYAQDANKMLSMARIFKSRYPQYYSPIEWELYPEHWVPMRDCLVSLVSDETRAFTPSMHLNRKIDLAFEPDVLTDPAYAPYVREMHADLARLYDSDPALTAAMEELLAYAVFTRGNPLKKIVNLVGAGNNGKSTFLQRILNLVGPLFATTLDAKHLCGRGDPTKPNPGLKSAIRCNFTCIEEPSKADPMSAACMKEYSGNTEVKQRNLHENYALSQKNNMTMFINSNHPVKCTDTDEALLSRMERVHMPCSFFRTADDRTKALAVIECGIERAASAPKYHVGDPNFAKRYEAPKMRQVYFAFLKAQYKNYVARGSLAEVPDAYSYRGCEAEELEMDAIDLYDELVEETGADTDYMTAKALSVLLKAPNTIALGRQMKTRILKSTKVKDARRNKTRGFVGIRPRNGAGYGLAVGAYDAAGSGFF